MACNSIAHSAAIDSEPVRARGIIVNNLLYDQTSLGQICALWLVLSRSGFCSTDRFHGNGPSRVFLFGSKAGKFKNCNQNSEKNVNIVIFHSETARKSWKDCRIFTKISKMEEKDKHSPSEVSIILNIWILLMQRQASTKARRPKTVLSTNRKVKTA